jgi:DNA-binding Lrp family transcriptional regulator
LKICESSKFRLNTIDGKKGWLVRETELKLMAELMKNSRRSDRELAKAIGVSQPTISRVIKKLEEEGFIKEYTVVPDFNKLGFQILAVTFTKLKDHFPDEVLKSKRKEVSETLEKEPIPDILHMTGMGLGAERILLTLHTDYASYVKFINNLEANPQLNVKEITSFMVSLADGTKHFRSLSMSQVANYLLKKKE